jgi:hypothetical protein
MYLHGEQRTPLLLASACVFFLFPLIIRSFNEKMFFILALCLCLASIYSMPYNVPLQGEAGGKRTLVLLDNLVSTK